MGDIFTVTVIVGLFSGMIRMATPILFAAIGEMVTERSGILNLGVEGTMLMGAFIGFYATVVTGSLWMGILFAMLVGTLFGLLIAFLTYSLKTNQIIAGLVINLMAAGISFYWYRAAFLGTGSGSIPTIQIFQRIKIPWLGDIPYLGQIFFNQYILTYIAFLLVPVVWFFLYKTPHGLVLRSIGENPRAVDLKGVNVALYSYLAVMFGGMMAGIGGAFLTISSTGLFVTGITAGRGWLAIVIVIAGNWRPARILLATLLFSFLDSFQMAFEGAGLALPYQLFLAFPYIAAIFVLIMSRAKSESPAALGLPYIRE